MYYSKRMLLIIFVIFIVIVVIGLIIVFEWVNCDFYRINNFICMIKLEVYIVL